MGVGRGFCKWSLRAVAAAGGLGEIDALWDDLTPEQRGLA